MIVLITGTSRGLGQFLAGWLRERGHVVVGTSRRPAPGSGDLALDVTSPDSCAEVARTVLAQHGRVDALINNAGSHLVGAALETSPEELRSQVDLNLFGVANMVGAVAPSMVERRSGRIVTVSSVGGVFAMPFTSAYSASKFAVEGYSRALRAELAPFGVPVSTLTPGFLRTSTHDRSVVPVRGFHPLFTPHRERLAARMLADGARGLPLERVGRTVDAILRSRRPRARYSVDGLAPLLQFLQAVVPSALFEPWVTQRTAAGFPGAFTEGAGASVRAGTTG
jgi:NAD(P)-dependent dehydrogenase (short-subunit alcohol dehydrogenase family)